LAGRNSWPFEPADLDGITEAMPGTLLSGNLRDSPTGIGPEFAPSVDAAGDVALQQNFWVVSPGA